jgi:ABC-type glycerol-3-phosphate transport system permease component
MKNLLEFVKTTAVGGLVVILPVAVVFVLLERVLVTVRAAR